MRRLSRDYLATRSRALGVAQPLATIAGWRLDVHSDALLRGLDDCRYEPVADLVQTPWGANTVRAIDHQLRSIRCDAVLPAMGKTNAGHDSMYVSIALWSAAGIDWHRALRLCSHLMPAGHGSLPIPMATCQAARASVSAAIACVRLESSRGKMRPSATPALRSRMH